jgi:hypothetical protein
MVRVKFVLKKQCAFGQQFLVVGDAPALGQWDPSKATALDGEDGEIQSVCVLPWWCVTRSLLGWTGFAGKQADRVQVLAARCLGACLLAARR